VTLVLPLLYTAELALDDADTEAFLQWYAYRHAPDLFPIGFQVCTCYRAVVGDMTFLDIYEIPSWDIFTSRAYARMAERDRYAAEILARRRNKAHTIYEQRRLAPAGEVSGPSLDADWITAIRFDASLTGDEVAQALQAEAARLAGDGAAAVRLAERTRDHPTYTTHRPRFLLLSEWSERPQSDQGLLNRLERQMGGAVSDTTFVLGRRAYPWPDTPT
jgi:hypothetical protein